MNPDDRFERLIYNKPEDGFSTDNIIREVEEAIIIGEVKEVFNIF